MKRPDISYSLQVLSQFMHTANYSNMNSTMKILKYIQINPRLNLLSSSTNKVKIKAYYD